MSLKSTLYTNHDENAKDFDSYQENPDGVPAQIKARVLELINTGCNSPLHIRNGLQADFGVVDYAHINTALERLDMDGLITIDESGWQTKVYPKGEAQKKTLPNRKGGGMTANSTIQNSYVNSFKVSDQTTQDALGKRILATIEAGESLAHRICVVAQLPAHKVESELSELVIDGKLDRVRVAGLDAYFPKGEVPSGRLYLNGNKVSSISEPAPAPAVIEVSAPTEIITNQIEDLEPETVPETKPVRPYQLSNRFQSNVTAENIRNLPLTVVTIEQIAKALSVAPGTVASTMSRKPDVKTAIVERRSDGYKKSGKFTPTNKLTISAGQLWELEQMVAQGLSTAAISTNIKINPHTLKQWCYGSDRPDVRAAFLRGKSIRDANTQPKQVEAVLVSDARLNETVERLESDSNYRREVALLEQSLEKVAPKQTATDRNVPATLSPDGHEQYLAELERELNDNKLLFRKLSLEKQYSEVWGETSPKAAEVWAELERKAA